MESHGNVLGFEILKQVDPPLYGKIAKIVIYDKAWVTGGTNYDTIGQKVTQWVFQINLN